MSAIPADIPCSVLPWSFPSLSAARGPNVSLSAVFTLDVRILLSLVFTVGRGVLLEKLLCRFCKFSLSNSTVKPETGDRKASCPLGAFGLFPPRVLLSLGGLQNPFLLLRGLVGAEASMRSVFCSKGRMSHPESPKAATVGWVLFRAVFCRFLISSKLMSSSSSRNALTEMELLHFP